MTQSVQSGVQAEHSWVYASLTVVDGTRQLKPQQVGPDRIVFAEAPRLEGSKLDVIITNGDDVRTYAVEVLPHELGATRIPIRLLR
jgi:hypothetical protein